MSVSQKNSLFFNTSGASVSAVLTKSVYTPFEKMKSMTMNKPKVGQFTAFMKNNMTNVIKFAPNPALVFGIKEECQKRIFTNSSLGGNIASGAAAGFLVSLASQ